MNLSKAIESVRMCAKRIKRKKEMGEKINPGWARLGKKMDQLVVYASLQRTDEPTLETRNYGAAILGQDNKVCRHLLNIIYFLSIIGNYHAQFKLQRP